MKRACILVVALLAILLVYPASMPSAKSPGRTDHPTIQVITPISGPGDRGFSQSGEDDDGDQDDIAGIKKGRRPLGGGSGVSAYSSGSAAKVWWMYFFSYVRIMH